MMSARRAFAGDRYSSAVDESDDTREVAARTRARTPSFIDDDDDEEEEEEEEDCDDEEENKRIATRVGEVCIACPCPCCSCCTCPPNALDLIAIALRCRSPCPRTAGNSNAFNANTTLLVVLLVCTRALTAAVAATDAAVVAAAVPNKPLAVIRAAITTPAAISTNHNDLHEAECLSTTTAHTSTARSSSDHHLDTSTSQRSHRSHREYHNTTHHHCTVQRSPRYTTFELIHTASLSLSLILVTKDHHRLSSPLIILFHHSI